MRSAGWVPAEIARHPLRSAYRLNSAAAIWERPALWTQAKRYVFIWLPDSCGRRMSSAVSGNEGMSQRINTVAAIAPHICAAMKKGTSTGRIPAKVSDTARAMVTAGFANDVDDVNQ